MLNKRKKKSFRIYKSSWIKITNYYRRISIKKLIFSNNNMKKTRVRLLKKEISIRKRLNLLETILIKTRVKLRFTNNKDRKWVLIWLINKRTLKISTIRISWKWKPSQRNVPSWRKSIILWGKILNKLLIISTKRKSGRKLWLRRELLIKV